MRNREAIHSLSIFGLLLVIFHLNFQYLSRLHVSFKINYFASERVQNLNDVSKYNQCYSINKCKIDEGDPIRDPQQMT